MSATAWKIGTQLKHTITVLDGDSEPITDATVAVRFEGATGEGSCEQPDGNVVAAGITLTHTADGIYTGNHDAIAFDPCKRYARIVEVTVNGDLARTIVTIREARYDDG